MNYSMFDDPFNHFMTYSYINIHTDRDPYYNYYVSPKLLSNDQKFKLARIFRNRTKVSREETAALAAEFNVSTSTINTWFSLQRRYQKIRGKKHQSKDHIYMYI